MADELDIVIKQGSTLSMTLKYSQPQLSVVVITAVTKSGQAIITAAGHGIPSDWQVWIAGVGGMSKINHRSEELGEQAFAYYAYYVSTSQMRLDLDTTRFGTYTSGGELLFHPPVDLTGYTARMQIRADVEATTVIHSMTDTNGITLGGVNGSVALEIPATTTDDFDFDTAVYDLELVSPAGVVTTLAAGAVELVREVTR